MTENWISIVNTSGAEARAGEWWCIWVERSVSGVRSGGLTRWYVEVYDGDRKVWGGSGDYDEITARWCMELRDEWVNKTLRVVAVLGEDPEKKDETTVKVLPKPSGLRFSWIYAPPEVEAGKEVIVSGSVVADIPASFLVKLTDIDTTWSSVKKMYHPGYGAVDFSFSLTMPNRELRLRAELIENDVVRDKRDLTVRVKVPPPAPSPPPPPEKEEKGDVVGYVVDEEAWSKGVFEPIPGAEVEINGKKQNTDEMGLFWFKGIKFGSYTIKARASGYEEASKSVVVDKVHIDAGKLFMRKIGAKPPEKPEKPPEEKISAGAIAGVIGVISAVIGGGAAYIERDRIKWDRVKRWLKGE